MGTRRFAHPGYGASQQLRRKAPAPLLLCRNLLLFTSLHSFFPRPHTMYRYMHERLKLDRQAGSPFVRQIFNQIIQLHHLIGRQLIELNATLPDTLQTSGGLTADP